MANWKCLLELDSSREITAGSEADLCAAIRNGADLRIQTEFGFNEHLYPDSDNPETVREVADFRVTYLIDDRWVSGIMNLRQPIMPPGDFGPRPSMSFFLYNQNGLQAIARPHLDGVPANGDLGPSQVGELFDMPKYHESTAWDSDTNAPSHNFVYDFDLYRFFVCDEWEEVLSHNSDGKVISGSMDAIMEEFSKGRDIKVGIRDLCADRVDNPEDVMPHEIFIQTGPGYLQTVSRLFCAGSHPLIRVNPNIPMHYESGNWDFGWVLPHTDGMVSSLIYDPYTLKTRRNKTKHAIRWFVR